MWHSSDMFVICLWQGTVSAVGGTVISLCLSWILWLGFSIPGIVLRKLPVDKVQTIIMYRVVIKPSSELSFFHILPGQYFIGSLVYMKVNIVLIGKMDRKMLDS